MILKKLARKTVILPRVKLCKTSVTVFWFWKTKTKNKAKKKKDKNLRHLFFKFLIRLYQKKWVCSSSFFTTHDFLTSCLCYSSSNCWQSSWLPDGYWKQCMCVTCTIFFSAKLDRAHIDYNYSCGTCNMHFTLFLGLHRLKSRFYLSLPSLTRVLRQLEERPWECCWNPPLKTLSLKMKSSATNYWEVG